MRGVLLSPDANHRRREGREVDCRHGRRITPPSWRADKIPGRAACDDPGEGRLPGRAKSMAIDAEQAAIRTVITTVLAELGEGSGRGLDALFAMRQAEAIVRALEHEGYEIRRRR
jgi:hypothetical protein